MMRTGSRVLIKQINHNITLNLIKSRGPLSRTEIARISGLSLATISGLTGELLATGFIKEAGEGESTGGRPPVLLRLNPRGGYVIGLKLAEQQIVAALADLEANVVRCQIEAVDDMSDPDTTVGTIIAVIEASIAAADIARDKIMGIGIGMAGIIDTAAGRCRYSPMFGWRNVPLAHPLEHHFDLPVLIDNDVNTLTAAELWFGRGRGFTNFLVVTVGRGIGMGVVVNGQLYRGAAGGAGEFGHITLEENGPRCGCGKRGCLEALCGDHAVERMAREAVMAGRQTALADATVITAEAVTVAAQEGDAVALEILARAGRALGLGLSYLVNLFDPQLIVISGEGTRAGEALIGPAREMMRRHVFAGLGSGPRVIIESLGDEAWARGAACVVLSELFKHPILQETGVHFPARVA